MGILRGLLTVLVLFSSLNVFANLLEAPPLRVVAFDKLLFPVKLNKSQIKWMLQKAMDGMYGKSFVDMGDVTDLMHGHVILKPQGMVDISLFKFTSLESIESTPLAQNSQLEPVAILFHSHEYDHLRKGMPYIGPYGELDAYNRNWILFLVDTAEHKRGDLVDANKYYKSKSGTKTYTINPEDLPNSLFDFDIGRWSYSFYFFRTDCEVSDLIPEQEGLSLTEVYNSVAGERVCLNITSFHCRNHPNDIENCGGAEVPLFDIFKDWPQQLSFAQ